jgi:hypothetical protein
MIERAMLGRAKRRADIQHATFSSFFSCLANCEPVDLIAYCPILLLQLASVRTIHSWKAALVLHILFAPLRWLSKRHLLAVLCRLTLLPADTIPLVFLCLRSCRARC